MHLSKPSEKNVHYLIKKVSKFSLTFLGTNHSSMKNSNKSRIARKQKIFPATGPQL